MVCPLNKSEYEEMGDSFLLVQLSQGTLWHRCSPENEAQPIIERFATATPRQAPLIILIFKMYFFIYFFVHIHIFIFLQDIQVGQKKKLWNNFLRIYWKICNSQCQTCSMVHWLFWYWKIYFFVYIFIYIHIYIFLQDIPLKTLRYIYGQIYIS